MQLNMGKYLSIFAATILLSSEAMAESSKNFLLELNTAETKGDACSITFVVKNELEASLEKVAYEFAFFDKQGRVDRISLLDFKSIAPQKMKVNRFKIPAIRCENISRILINENTACQQSGAKSDFCKAALKTENKTLIEFLK